MKQLLLLVSLTLLTAFQTQAESRNFLLGGQIPFWLLEGEAGTPSDTARKNILPHAERMFDIVIPSAMTWGWIEDRRGALDFHRYE